MSNLKDIQECSHENAVQIQEAQIVYGTPGVLPARFVCRNCGIWWDDPTIQPQTVGTQVWRQE